MLDRGHRGVWLSDVRIADDDNDALLQVTFAARRTTWPTCCATSGGRIAFSPRLSLSAATDKLVTRPTEVGACGLRDASS